MLFTAADLILKDQMDKTIEIFANTQTDFYNQYKSARKVVNDGSVTTKVRGSVVNQSGEIVPLAKVFLTDTIIQKVTPKGTFEFEPVPFGTYNMKVLSDGYKPCFQTVVAKKGQSITIKFILEVL